MSACRSVPQNVLDTADIVRDGDVSTAEKTCVERTETKALRESTKNCMDKRFIKDQA
jgi:hypothetical protein